MGVLNWFGRAFDRFAESVARASGPAASLESGAAVALREAAGNQTENEDGWRRLSGDAGRDLSGWDIERQREAAVYLWGNNLLANRLIELPLAYLLAEGVSLRAPDEEMNKVIARFWADPINEMDLKLPKKVRELSLFGEQVWPAFVNEVDGHVRLGYLDPSKIGEVVFDPDNAEQPIGIITVQEAEKKPLRYRVIINGDEDCFTERTRAIREGFADGECFYFRVNDLAWRKPRGVSDLAAQIDWVDLYDTFLIGEMERANLLRAVVWDLEVNGATPDEVKTRSKEFRPPSPGSAYVHNQQEKLEPKAPSMNAGDSDTIARLFRNHALGGATLPEHWFGGGGDVNRAVGAEMGEPTFKILSMRQTTWKHILEAVGRYVLRKHLMAGDGAQLEFDDPRLVVEAQFPELTARDTTKYAAALQQVIAGAVIAIERGLITEETACELIAAISGRLGVEIEPAKELKAATEARDKRMEANTFTGPDGSNGPPNPPDPNGANAAANAANLAAAGAKAAAAAAA